MNGDLVWSFHPRTFEIQWVNPACQDRLGMQVGEDCRTYLRPDLHFIESVVDIVGRRTRWEGVLNFIETRQRNFLPLFSKVIQIEIRTEQIDSRVRIHVTDSGPGISPEIADQVMKPFFTTKEAGFGTGLGLSISQTLVLDHGGRLFLNLDSQNTSFMIELPALQIRPK